jgi:branched-chain amino acid transport system substrate-binding protein
MARSWAVVAPVAAAAVVLAGCSNSDTAGTGGPDPYNVLAITALSGPLAAVGTPQMQAVKAAVNYLNSQGGISGHEVKLTISDDASDASKAVSILQQALTSGSKPNLVLPGASSNETLAMLPVLNRNKILSIASTGAAAISDPAKYPYSFGGSFTPDAAPGGIARYVVGKGYKKVGVLRANDAYGTPWFGFLSDALSKAGVTVVESAYDPTSVDLSPDLGKLNSANPDAIVAEGFGAPVGAIYAARAKLGNYSIPLIADNTISSGNPWKLANNPAALQNSVLEVYAVQQAGGADQKRPAVQTMLSWVQKLGPLTAGISLYALEWDIFQSVNAAVRAAGSTDPVKVAPALESLQAGQGAWAQNLGDPPGYTASVHFAKPNPANYLFIKPGPLVAGSIKSQT